MPYELFLALRYMRARRGRRVARWTALAAVVGIACGVAALTVASALANGFRDELRDKILRGTAHVTLSRTDAAGLEDARRVAARVREVEGVTDATPTAYEGALLTGPRGAAYTMLRGVDAQGQRERAELQSTLTKGTLDALFQTETQRDAPAPVLLGEELAKQTGLTELGDEGWVLTGETASAQSNSTTISSSNTTPGAASDTNAFVPRARRVRVAGVFRSGLYEYDSAWTYLSLEETARVVGGASQTVISVEARDIYASSDVARRARSALGEGWTAVDWRDANRPLFDALALERRTVTLIIMLITIVAALNITTTLALVVVERRADIAVLVALGARARSVTLVFMFEGALIGAAGAIAGVAFGVAACFVADRFQLVSLPADVYSLASVPLHPHAWDVLLTALAAFAVSLLATVYPARQAARVRPAEVLRYE